MNSDLWICLCLIDQLGSRARYHTADDCMKPEASPWRRNRQDVPATDKFTMRLPVLAIESFQSSCQVDITRIWTFMEHKTPRELGTGPSIQILEAYENPCGAKWMQRGATTNRQMATRTSIPLPGLVWLWRPQGWPLLTFCEPQATPFPYKSHEGRPRQLIPIWHVTPPFRISTVGWWPLPIGIQHTPGGRQTLAAQQ